jgi:AraC-like DNA-binding protein
MNSSFATCSHAAAGTFVKYFWQMEGNPSYEEECILPKGEIELIFSFSCSVGFEHFGSTDGGVTSRCFINGLRSTPIRLFIPRHQWFFGVVLQPAAVRKLLHAPSGTFLNAVTDLELVDKAFTPLWHEVADSANFQERVSIIEQWVITRVTSIHQQEMTLSGFLTSPDELSTVARLAERVCYSPRQLQRKAHELFGMPPELLLRYKRYRQALYHLHTSTDTLTKIAYQCGYYDQAHFNREFKEYTGLTPGTYRRKRSVLPGHLYL